jgi:hypothetical protein
VHFFNHSCSIIQHARYRESRVAVPAMVPIVLKGCHAVSVSVIYQRSLGHEAMHGD